MDTNLVRQPQTIPPPPPVPADIDRVARLRPRLVVAHPEAAYATLVSRHFRRLGWCVEATTSAEEARCLTHLRAPMAVILGTDLADETGWLACTKLVAANPGLKVILVVHDRSAVGDRFAEFVGAARLVSEADGVAALVDEVYDTALAAAG
jgi:hypothetical protein